jgi:hypothetical protein
MPQYARPSSDLLNSVWTPLSGENLWQDIDEETVVNADADYVWSRSGSSNVDTFVVKVDGISNWPEEGVLKLKVRLRKDGEDDKQVTVRLLQAGAEIARRVIESPPTGFYTFVFELTSEERRRIFRYSQLQVEVRAGVNACDAIPPSTSSQNPVEVTTSDCGCAQNSGSFTSGHYPFLFYDNGIWRWYGFSTNCVVDPGSQELGHLAVTVACRPDGDWDVAANAYVFAPDRVPTPGPVIVLATATVPKDQLVVQGDKFTGSATLDFHNHPADPTVVNCKMSITWKAIA